MVLAQCARSTHFVEEGPAEGVNGNPERPVSEVMSDGYERPLALFMNAQPLAHSWCP